MSFYIAPYSLFPLHRHYYRCFSLYIYNRYTDYWCFLIYIEKTLFFLLYFAQPIYIYSVFPIVKITLFCLYISFVFCPDCSVCFSYIYGNQTFCPIKICVLLYIQKKDAFLLYIFILYMCIFPIYIGVFLLYINHFFFFSFPPAHSISVYRENNAFIYSTVQIMVFFLYIGKYCPFFSYISCHCISYRCFSIYISIKDTPFFFYFAQIPYIAFPQTVFLYIVLNTLFLLIFCPDSKFLYFAYIQ